MNRNYDKESLILQYLSIILLMQDYKNSDLMQELQVQDEKYLKKIIEQNEEIIRLLKGSDDYGRKINAKN